MPSSTFKLRLWLKWHRGNRRKFWESWSIFRHRQYRYYCLCKGNGDGDIFFFQVYWKFLNFRIAISFWVQTPVKEKRTYNQTLLLLQKKRPIASSYVNLKAVISDWNILQDSLFLKNELNDSIVPSCNNTCFLLSFGSTVSAQSVKLYLPLFNHLFFCASTRA